MSRIAASRAPVRRGLRLCVIVSCIVLTGCATSDRGGPSAHQPYPAYGQRPSLNAYAGPRAAPPFHGLAVTEPTLDYIRHSEALRLESYQDAAGHWTIGYGHTGPHVKRGMRITAAQAEYLFRQDVEEAASAVRATVRQPLNHEEFSALTALAYNIGNGAFGRSTLVQRLNGGDRMGAADAFMMWVKMTVEGQKITSTHLMERRATERALFLGLPPLAQG